MDTHTGMFGRSTLMPFSRWFLFAAVLSVAAVNAKIATPVEIQNYKFFDAESGESIAWKGVDYYPRANNGDLNKNNVDVYTEDFRHIWEQDIHFLKLLGVNAIRIYAVDPSKNHDLFMCALRANGIYVIVGMAANSANSAVTLDAPPNCYSAELKERGQFLINEFARYENVLAFSAGNEISLVIQPPMDQGLNAPCQKKFIRDMRAYIHSCPSMRPIPVGLVVADIAQKENALYYNCLTDQNDAFENAEWYGINAYRQCDGTQTEISQAQGLLNLAETFRSINYSIPVVLTEFGCLNKNTFQTISGYESQRHFLQAKWLFDPEFRDIFSGGFAFEYSAELENAQITSPYPFTSFGFGNYGIGWFSPKECDSDTIPCVYNPKPEFYNLQSAYAATNARGIVSTSSFVPDENRMKRSDCPYSDTLRNLTDFSWSSDSTNNLSCTSLVSFTCPIVNIPLPQENATESPSISSPSRLPSGSPSRVTSSPVSTASGSPSGRPSEGIPHTTAEPSSSPSRATSLPSEGPTTSKNIFVTIMPSVKPSTSQTTLSSLGPRASSSEDFSLDFSNFSPYSPSTSAAALHSLYGNISVAAQLVTCAVGAVTLWMFV